MSEHYMQNLIGLVIHREGEGLLRGKTRCGLARSSGTWSHVPTADAVDELVRTHNGFRCTDCWPAKEGPTT